MFSDDHRMGRPVSPEVDVSVRTVGSGFVFRSRGQYYLHVILLSQQLIDVSSREHIDDTGA